MVQKWCRCRGEEVAQMQSAQEVVQKCRGGLEVQSWFRGGEVQTESQSFRCAEYVHRSSSRGDEIVQVKSRRCKGAEVMRGAEVIRRLLREDGAGAEVVWRCRGGPDEVQVRCRGSTAEYGTEEVQCKGVAMGKICRDSAEMLNEVQKRCRGGAEKRCCGSSAEVQRRCAWCRCRCRCRLWAAGRGSAEGVLVQRWCRGGAEMVRYRDARLLITGLKK